MQRVLRIGHRGAAGYAPENTLASIEKAISLDLDLVEVDVQRTRDGHLVILHDERVDRTTNGTGLVSEIPLRSLRKLDAGVGQCIPTLLDVLQAANGRIGLILELKVQGLAAQSYEGVQRSAFDGPVIYASFVHSEMRSIREADPQALTMALFGRLGKNTAFAAAQSVQATHVGFNYRVVTKSLVETCHQRGLVVFVYTVNERQDIQKQKSLGVDGIISDFPDRL
jgi:glycerophosphoryl diester phosphodiesterase